MSRRGGSSRWTQWIDREDVVAQLLAGNRSRSLPTTRRFGLPTEILALPHHGSRCAGVRTWRRREFARLAAVARAAHHQTEAGHRNLSLPSSTRSRIVFRSARHCVAEKYGAAPTPRACRSRRSIRLGRHVLGQFRQETAADDPSPCARQTVHDDQRVTRERPRARRRDSKVQERGTSGVARERAPS